MKLRPSVVLLLVGIPFVLGPGVSAGASAPPAFSGPVGRAAPYEYLGWGHPQSPTVVMAKTGIAEFTLAFVLSDGTCNPAWDGTRPLMGGVDQTTIQAIRDAGGEVTASFGGWSGKKLGEACTTPDALAGAYQEVIDAYQLKAIDVDIEHTEMAHGAVRQRVVEALQIVAAEDPGIRISVTMGTAPDGPDAHSLDLIHRAAAIGLHVDAWTIMPFDFGQPESDMGQVSIDASEGLKADLMAAYQESASAAYTTMGISSMNGQTDEADETVTLDDFDAMLAYAQAHHLARFTFWSVNRDRKCRHGSDSDSCSGIAQKAFAFTKVIARYHG